MLLALQSCYHIGKHNIDAFDLQEKLFFPPFSLQSMFIHEIRQTWKLIIILIIFVNGHYNHVLHIGIHDINAMELHEKFFFLPFSSWPKFLHEMRKTWILIIFSILFVICTLDLQEKLFFPPFSLKSKFIHEMRQTWILILFSILFVIYTTIMFFVLGYKILMIWICEKSFLSPFPL